MACPRLAHLGPEHLRKKAEPSSSAIARKKEGLFPSARVQNPRIRPETTGVLPLPAFPILQLGKPRYRETPDLGRLPPMPASKVQRLTSDHPVSTVHPQGLVYSSLE